MNKTLRMMAAFTLVLASLIFMRSAGMAQDEPESMIMSAQTAFCTQGLPAPQEGCSPWDGVVVSVVSADESFSTSCSTSSTSDAFVSSCAIDPPFGSTITASIDPASIPSGYELDPNQSTSQTITIPDGPVDGPVYGPQFYIYPISDGGSETFNMSALTAFCSPGLPAPQQGCSPWDGVVVTVTSDDGLFNTSCTTTSTSDAFVSACAIDPPFGSTITASIDPASIRTDTKWVNFGPSRRSLRFRQVRLMDRSMVRRSFFTPSQMVIRSPTNQLPTRDKGGL